ncbi:MAG: hypothetical protein AB2L20_03900 [Mangrovibacterium sp.]
MRKMILYTMLLTIASAFLSGCGLDNYDAPRSVLTGKVVYNGQNIGGQRNRQHGSVGVVAAGL